MEELVFKCFTYKGKLWTYRDGKLQKVILKKIGNLDKTSPGWDKSFQKDFILVDIETKRDNTFYTKNDKVIITLPEEVAAERWYGEW